MSETVFWNGRYRKAYSRVCQTCQKTYLGTDYSNLKYCSMECYRNVPKNLVEVCCSTCGESIKRKPSSLRNSKSGLYFCNRTCKAVALENRSFPGIIPDHYGSGASFATYRARALKRYGKVCVVCGFDQDARMLDVDHKDSNRLNNKIENLQVLCVWCHAVKTRKIENCPSRLLV